MNQSKIRKTLQSLESELQERLQKVSKDLAKKHSQDFAEQATERENEEVLLRLQEDATMELTQIKHSYRRLEEGVYGLCEKCGEKIREERLEIMPYTSLCFDCAE